MAKFSRILKYETLVETIEKKKKELNEEMENAKDYSKYNNLYEKSLILTELELELAKEIEIWEGEK